MDEKNMTKIKDLKTKEVKLSNELFCEELNDEQLESVVGGLSPVLIATVFGGLYHNPNRR